MSWRATTVLGLILITGFAATALSAIAPDVPHHLVGVGILRTSENARVADSIADTVGGAGYRVGAIAGGGDASRDWFAETDSLDVVVRPTWDPSTKEATALLFFRGFPDPRWVRRVGDSASRDLALAVVEVLTDSALLMAPLGNQGPAAEGAIGGPASVRADVLDALRLMSESKHAEALAPLERAAAAEPNNLQILYNLAFCHQQLGNSQEVRQYAERALRIDKRHGPTNILLGNEQLARGRLADAVAFYEIARQSPATASVANWNLAVAYNRMNRPDKVREHLLVVSDTSAQAFDAQRWLTLIDEKVQAVQRAAERRTLWLSRIGLAAFGTAAALFGWGLWRLLRQAKISKSELLTQLVPTVASGVFALLSALLPYLLGKVE